MGARVGEGEGKTRRVPLFKDGDKARPRLVQVGRHAELALARKTLLLFDLLLFLIASGGGGGGRRLGLDDHRNAAHGQVGALLRRQHLHLASLILLERHR